MKRTLLVTLLASAAAFGCVIFSASPTSAQRQIHTDGNRACVTERGERRVNYYRMHEWENNCTFGIRLKVRVGDHLTETFLPAARDTDGDGELDPGVGGVSLTSASERVTEFWEEF